VFLIVPEGLMDCFYTAAIACRMESFSKHTVRSVTVYVVVAIGEG